LSSCLLSAPIAMIARALRVFIAVYPGSWSALMPRSVTFRFGFCFGCRSASAA
jgi:hypothetical protein